MKNLFLKLALGLVIALISIAFITKNSKAQCPPGYSHYELAMTIGGCDYKVDVCVECSPQAPATKIHIRGIYLQHSACNTLPFDVVVANLKEQLLTQYYLNIICPNPFPPCDEKKFKEIVIETPICWSILKDLDINQNIIKIYLACFDNAYCVETMRFCRNEFNKLLKEIDPPFVLGIINCTEDFPVDETVVFNNLKIGETTVCYKIKTKCSN